MLFLYLLISFIFIVIAKNTYKSLLNPVSIYNVIWATTVLLYSLKLISYQSLSLITWFVLFIFIISFDLSVLLMKGKTTRKYNLTDVRVNSKVLFYLKKTVLITSLISALAIVPNFLNLVSQYGLDEMLSSINDIYIERTSGSDYVGYFSPVIYTSLLFLGFYYRENGIKPFFILPIVLAIMNALSFGGRNNIIISFLAFILPIVNTYDFKKLNFKKVVSLILIVSIFIYVFYIINYSRSEATTVSIYASKFLVNLNDTFTGIYKIYSYITSPIGVLNEYLKNPFYSFGANTFLPLYKQLVKIGFDIDLLWTLPFYQIPISSNVGSYITELIIDFTLFGSIIVNIILGLIVGYNYKMTKNSIFFLNKTIYIFLEIVIILSFFMWYFRSINIWISLIASCAFAIYIDKKINKRYKYERNYISRWIRN